MPGLTASTCSVFSEEDRQWTGHYCEAFVGEECDLLESTLRTPEKEPVQEDLNCNVGSETSTIAKNSPWKLTDERGVLTSTDRKQDGLGRTVKCPHHFGHRVKKCLEPYWSLAALFSPTRNPRLLMNDVLTKQLCLHFEMALVCLHSALTECPSAVNVKHVQSKLGSDWAMETRDLCLGQSETLSNQLLDDPQQAEDEGYYEYYEYYDTMEKTPEKSEQTSGSAVAIPGGSRSACRRPLRLSAAGLAEAVSAEIGMAAHNDHARDVVDETEIRRKAYRWCKDSIGGVWTKITSDEMMMEPVSGGMSNYLYLCRLPKGVKPLHDEPYQVLLRIYGHVTTSNMDILVHNSVVFALLSEKRLGPKPYGMFFDGRIEEFILARPLKHTDLSKPEIMKMVAEKLAAFHSLDMPLCKKPRWMFAIIKQWISEIQNNFSGHSKREKGGERETILRLQAIDMEKEEIVSKVESPVVFCHNDLQEGNILYNAAEKDVERRMTIIDWEYGNYNHRGFDLANHFCEWAIGYDTTSFTIEPERYPSRQQQYSFFRHYLKAYGQEDVTDEDLRKMYAEVNTLALASHFLWGCWATVQGHSSSIDFCYWDYAVSRFESYFTLKEQLPRILKDDA
ncbi:hypothetical protein BaRGS_00019935 [Batillaria attramentaria]|uniref:Choline kinase n=1 Tax=Batillaria attramentaria TaxID=370345 RepID=A0ABD0KPS2_9CAEN